MAKPSDNTGLSRAALDGFVSEIEAAETEKRTIAERIKEIYAEAKGGGFDVKTLRAVVRRRRMAADKRRREDELLATYEQALGMLD